MRVYYYTTIQTVEVALNFQPRYMYTNFFISNLFFRTLSKKSILPVDILSVIRVTCPRFISCPHLFRILRSRTLFVSILVNYREIGHFFSRVRLRHVDV